MGLNAQEVQSGPVGTVFDWLAARLSRVTSSREFIPEVDGLRFVALLPVLILHCGASLMWARRGSDFSAWAYHDGIALRVIGLGGIGVQIFFVISGFVVALPFARHALRGAPRPSVGKYFLRRVTRIEPPYLLALITYFAISPLHARLLPHLLAGMFYMHQFVFGTWNPILQPAWSLEVEVIFYIVAPWITCVYRIADRTDRWGLQVILIALYGACVRIWFASLSATSSRLAFISCMPFFLAGLLLADMYVMGALGRTKRLVWDVAFLSGAIAVGYAWGWGWDYWLAPFMIAAMFVGGMKGRLANSFLRMRVIAIVGGMCYTAYLWHSEMLRLIAWRLNLLIPRGIQDGRATLLFCLIALPLVIAATAPIYLLTEKPFMNGAGSRFLTKALIRIGGIFKKGPPINEERAVP